MENIESRRLWFKARRYGWGWTPCSIEGWLVTIFAALALVGGDWAIALLAGRSAQPGPIGDVGLHLPAGAAIAAVLGWNTLVLAPTIWICWKTGERPRWRWGNRGPLGPNPPDRGALS